LIVLSRWSRAESAGQKGKGSRKKKSKGGTKMEKKSSYEERE